MAPGVARGGGGGYGVVSAQDPDTPPSTPSKASCAAPTSFQRARRIVTWAFLTTLFTFCAWGYWSGVVPRALLGFMTAVEGLGYLGPIAMAAAFALMTVLLIPSTLLNIGAGYMYGPFAGYLVTAVGTSIGAVLAFVLGRYCVRGWIDSKIRDNPTLQLVNRALGSQDDQSFKIVCLSRLPPLFPFVLINYALGMASAVTDLKLWTYVSASVLGLMPSTLMDAYVGSLLSDLSGVGSQGAWDQGWYIVGVAGVTFLSTALIGSEVKRVLVKIEDAQELEDEELQGLVAAPDDFGLSDSDDE